MMFSFPPVDYIWVANILIKQLNIYENWDTNIFWGETSLWKDLVALPLSLHY